MKRIVIAAAALVASLSGLPSLAADLVAQEGATSIRLTDAACTSEVVLERIPPEARHQFRTASALVGGRPYAACWGALPTAVYLIYEDGDEGLLPMNMLQVPTDV